MRTTATGNIEIIYSYSMGWPKKVSRYQIIKKSY